MSDNNKKQKYKILILIAAMVLLTIAAFSAYGVVRAAIIKRECNVHRYITINLDGGTSSNMYWKSNVDRDATNYKAEEWISGSAAGCWLRPKDATEDRLTSIYYDNQDPCEGTFYEHIDCVGATPYVWIEEPTKEGYEFAGWTYEVKTEIGDGGSWEVKEGKVSYDSGYYYFSAGAYATTGNSNGACANIYLTAKWEPIIYIDYSTDGGTIDCDWVHLESGWIRPNTGEAYLEYVSPDGSLNPYNDVSFNLRKTGYHFTQWTNNGRSGMDYGVFDQDTSYHYDTWYNHSYYNDYHNGQYVDLYPDWQLNYAKLDYNANGGYIEDSAEWALDPNGWVRRNGASGDEQYWAENVYYGQSCNPYNDTSFGLKKDGYRFAGWKIKGTTIMLDQDTTYGWSAYCSPLGIDLADGLGFTPQWVDLEAVWEPMYQIDVNGSLDGVIDYSQEWGTFDVYINGSLLENDQMDFMQSFPVGTKWEIKDIKSVTDGIKYVGDETYSGTLQNEDVSIILPFMSNIAKYYNIDYDANGGTGTMASQVVMYDSEVILSHNQFKRSGYEFAGWSSDKNANTLEYTDGQTVKNITSADSTITLYALWTPIDYSIVYTKGYTNNAKDDVVQSGIKYDKETTLISNTFTGRSYTVKYDTTTTEYDWDKVTTPAGLSGTLEFAYWNILNNTYAAGTKLKNLTVKNGGKINATAQWKEKKFIFPVVSRPGYDFTGWYSAGDKKIYKGNTEYTISPAETAFNDTFIAQWTARTDTKYTVNHYKMNLDGSTYTLAETDNLQGTTDTTVTPNVKTYTGFTSPEKQTVTVKGDGSTVVKHYYKRNKYTIKYVPGTTNNNAGQSKTQDVFYDADVTTISNPYTGMNYSYTFNQGFTPSGNWDVISSLPSGKSDTLLFNKWNINNNRYDANKLLTKPNFSTVNGAVIIATATWNNVIVTLPNVTRQGYDFKGWYSSRDSKTYAAATNYTIAPSTYKFNTTFTAQWTARTDTKYTVRHWKEKLYLDNTTTYADPSKHDSTNYTLVDTDNLTGTTDSSVTPPVKKTYTGFTSPSEVTVKIKGDGTTIVDYYYTRNWYDHQVELWLETATGGFEEAPDNWSLAHVKAPNSQKNYSVKDGLCIDFRGKYEEPVSWYSDGNDCYKKATGTLTWKVGQDGKSHTKSNNNAYKVYVYRKAYGFNLESIIDGEKYLLEHGYGSVNIEINGTQVAKNVTNFSGSYRYGSTFDVTILENTGCDYIYQESYYTNANDNFKEKSNDRVISGQIIKDTNVYTAWRTTLDVVFNSNNGQSQTLTKHYTRATNESATNFNSTNYLLSDVSNWKKQYYVQLGWSDKADDNEKTFDLSRQDNYKLGEHIESAATRTESDWIKKNSPTKNLYMIWKENKAPTIDTGTLSEYYRTFYTGQTITNGMLMYNVEADDDYDEQAVSNNLHVQKVELLSGDRVVSTIYCNSSNKIDNFIIPQSKELTSYKVYFETTDAGRVDVGNCSTNTNNPYKETDKRTTVVSVQYKIVENQAPEINSVDKRIYKQTTDIDTVDKLKEFISQYQIAYDYEDNTDISHWWEVEGPNGTKQQLRKNLQVAESDETLQSIVDFITTKTNNETRQYDIKLTIKDQFNKTNTKEIKIKLYIMTSSTDEDIEISNSSTLYKYVPVNIQDVLSIDKFKQNKNLNQSQSDVIDDSLNNKENKSGQSESYSSNGKSVTIIEY